MAIEISSIERLARAGSSSAGTARPMSDKAVIPAAQGASPAVTREAVTSAVQQLQQAVNKGPNPDFSLDYLSGLSVVTVRSNRTGEVVFQLPDTRAVELARLLKDGTSLSQLGLVNFEV